MKPHVFVANHSSFTDVFLVVRLPWEMKWLAKKSIFSIPLLGWQLRVAGDVPIVRGDRESAQEAMEEMRKRLASGVSMILFPEGTRSPDGSLGEFRDGAFRLAIEAGVDVVPLAIAGAAKSLPKRSLVFRPSTATLRVLSPVPTAGLTGSDARSLGSAVRERIDRAIRSGPGRFGCLSSFDMVGRLVNGSRPGSAPHPCRPLASTGRSSRFSSPSLRPSPPVRGERGRVRGEPMALRARRPLEREKPITPAGRSLREVRPSAAAGGTEEQPLHLPLPLSPLHP